MRDKNPSSFEPTLGNCLMDSDPEVVRLTRSNRRRSLVLSSLIQAALLTAAIVLPLFASQTIPAFRNEPRLPGFKGIRVADTRPPGTQTTRSSGPRRPRPSDFFAPQFIPPSVPQPDPGDADAGSLDSAPPGTPGCAICSEEGLLPPEMFDRNTRVTPAPKVPAPDSRPRGPVRVSQPLQEAKLIHKVIPVYPPLMRQTRKSGRVELRAIIGRDGTINELTLISGDPGFVLAAQQAVLQWRYSPTVLNGEPVEVETHITVIFTMTN